MRVQLNANERVASTLVSAAVNITTPACLLTYFTWNMEPGVVNTSAEDTSYVHLLLSQYLAIDEVYKWRAMSPAPHHSVYTLVALPMGTYRIGFEARGNTAILDISSVTLTQGSCSEVLGK